MKLWQKVGIAAAAVLGGAWLVRSATGGAGAPAATPHGGTVGANGTTQTPTNSGSVAGSLVTGALTGAGFLLGQKAVSSIQNLLPGGSSTPEAGASAGDTSLVPSSGSEAEAAGGGTAGAEAGTVASEAAAGGEAAAGEATGILGEIEAAVGGVGGEVAGVLEAAPELELLAVL